MTIVRSIPTILFHLDGLTMTVAASMPTAALGGIVLGEHTDTGRWSLALLALTAASLIAAAVALTARHVYLRTPAGRRRAASAAAVLDAWHGRTAAAVISANLDRIDTDTDKGTR